MAKPFTLPKDGEQMDAAYMKAEFERNGWTKEEVIEYDESNTDWHALIEAATAKQITFVTA